jgi:broad specificity phosphatase PhoE
MRHAQTWSNVLGLLDSQVPGPDLTELGRRQAAALPGALRERPLSSVTVSHMVRTAQTAAPLASVRGLVPVTEPGIAEIPAGDLEMSSGAAALNSFTTVAWAWGAGDLEPRLAGSENGHEFFARFDDVVDRIADGGEDYPLIISHGGSIRVWVSHRCANVAPSFAADSALHNTGTALVERDALGHYELLEWAAMPAGGAELHGRSGPDDDSSPEGVARSGTRGATE